MSQVSTQIARVIENWVDREENSYGPAIMLKTLWMDKHGVASKYDPDGIDRLVDKVRDNQFFQNCSKAATLDNGFFVAGGRIQRVRDLHDFLNPCGD